MKIAVVETPGWPSPYGPDGTLVPLPKRMRYLHPEALASIAPLAAQGLVFSDVFRSPAASMQARATKRGVARPGRSAHNFGLAVDLDVARSIRAAGFPIDQKAQLDADMLGVGWRCYRSDHKVGASEAWHFTYGARAHGSAAIEDVIAERYGQAFTYDERTAQEYLAKLRLYVGEIDGAFGPQSRAALEVFQRGWDLERRGLSPETMRLLAVCAADLEVVP